MTSLFEKYRPRTLDDVVAQPKACELIRRLAVNGLGGRAYWFAGKSGTGKSSLARIIAGMVADDWCIEQYTARDLRVETVRELRQTLRLSGMGEKSGRAVIVEESHGLSSAVVEQLLAMLEEIPRHVVWCFCTTIEGEAKLFDGCIDSHPLLSRCIAVPMAQRDLARPMAEKALAIARAEGLDGKPIDAYVRLMNDCRGNMREALSSIEAGAMLS